MAGAAKYDRRIRVESPTRSTGDDGQQNTTWPELTDEPFATVWAMVEVEPIGQDFDRQQRTETTYTIRCRSSSVTRSITPRMRILLRDRNDGWRTLQIGAAADIQFAGVDVVIRATEQGAAGR